MTSDNAAGNRTTESGRATLFAALGYLPGMFFVPMLVGRPGSAEADHGRASMYLFLAFLACWLAILGVDLFVGRLMGSLVLIGPVFRAVSWLVHNVGGISVSIAYVVLAVMGATHAARGSQWRMPWVKARQ